MEEEAQEEKPQIVEKKLTKREKLDKKRKIEEYLDQHLPLNVPRPSPLALTLATEIQLSIPRSISNDIRIRTHGNPNRLRCTTK